MHNVNSGLVLTCGEQRRFEDEPMPIMCGIRLGVLRLRSLSGFLFDKVAVDEELYLRVAGGIAVVDSPPGNGSRVGLLQPPMQRAIRGHQ